MRWKYWLGLILVGALALSVLLFLMRTPGFWRAYFLKGIELERIPNTHIYVSPELSARQRESLLENYLKAALRVQQLWGGRQAAPVVLVGGTPDFMQHYESRHHHAAVTYFSPLGTHTVIAAAQANVDVLAHELAHAELTARIGWRKRETQIPTWFDEGLAMLVDHRFPNWYDDLLLMSRGGREIPSLEELRTPQAFFGSQRSLLNYFVAKKITQDWYRQQKSRGLREFSAQISSGTSFEAAWQGGQSGE